MSRGMVGSAAWATSNARTTRSRRWRLSPSQRSTVAFVRAEGVVAGAEDRPYSPEEEAQITKYLTDLGYV